MKKYKLFILIICFTSCTSQSNKKTYYTNEQIASLYLDSTDILTTVIDSVELISLNSFLENQSFDFGSLVNHVDLVPLETTDESLLDNIYKLLVTKSNIYVHDSFKGGGIVIFDSEGNFIKRINNGEGPGELRYLYDITYDNETNELLAYQHPFLLFFTSDGEFIKQIKLPFGCYNLSAIPTGYLFKTIDGNGNEHLNSFKDYTFLVTDKELRLKSIALPYLPNNINFGGYHYLHNNNNEIRVSQSFSDTIYQYTIETNKLQAKYILDYSEKKVPKRYLHTSKQEFNRAIQQNDYYYYLGEYLETKSHNVFFLRNDYTGLQTVIYRDKSTKHLIGGTNANFEIGEIPPIGFPKAVFGDQLVSICYPNQNDFLLENSAIISDKDKIKIREIREDDNPVLAFYRLVKF